VAGRVSLRRARLLGLALGLLACAGACSDARPPNIVLVIGDDLGWVDHGFMGAPVVETPVLDALARSGTVFSRGYATASTCRPSLRSLLTGLQPIQLEHVDALRRRRGEHLAEPQRLRGLATLPSALSAHGYASFQAGKYWEADYRIAGFDAGMQRPGDDASNGGVGRELGREIPLDGVAAFLEERRGKPFFLWFAPMLPHRPHDASERFAARYRGRGLSWTAFWYYANVTRFDALVGELLAMLDERGLRENTLVVYLADNGWDQRPDVDQAASFADGPRGKKTMYELGWRTPIVFSWPGVVPAGRVSDALVSAVDLFPTLLDYAGVPVPPGRPGHSLRGVIQEGADWPRGIVIGSLRGARVDPGSAAARSSAEPDDHQAFFVRNDTWWYVWFRDRGAEELYDARSDPRAERNVAADHPRVRETLRGFAESWARRMLRSAERVEVEADAGATR
jgi:arylsulfatase A-like enzyme